MLLLLSGCCTYNNKSTQCPCWELQARSSGVKLSAIFQPASMQHAGQVSFLGRNALGKPSLCQPDEFFAGPKHTQHTLFWSNLQMTISARYSAAGLVVGDLRHQKMLYYRARTAYTLVVLPSLMLCEHAGGPSWLTICGCGMRSCEQSGVSWSNRTFWRWRRPA